MAVADRIDLMITDPRPLDGHHFSPLTDATITLAGRADVWAYNRRTGEYDWLSNPGVSVLVQIDDGPSYDTRTDRGSWRVTVPVAPALWGKHTLTVSARFGHLSDSGKATVFFGDTTAPTLQVDPVKATVNVSPQGSIVELTGRAFDTQSGVATLQWRLDGGPWQTVPTPNSAGHWRVVARLTSLGSHTLSLQCDDFVGNRASHDSALLGVDENPPDLLILTSPNKPILVPRIGAPGDTHGGIRLDGVVWDQSSIAELAWSVNGADYFPMALPGPDDSAWSVTISGIQAVDTNGFLRTDKQRISIRATDAPAFGAAPNVATVSIELGFERALRDATDAHPLVHILGLRAARFRRPVNVALVTMALGLAEETYLGDLMEFVEWLLGGVPDGLESRFFQPFRKLVAATAALTANAPVHRARLAAGVLKAYVETLNLSPEQSRPLTESIASYHHAVYRELLSQLGTSYGELAAAYGAEAEVRQALAGRLGLDLGTARPDALDELLPIALAPEGWPSFLETRFGYAKIDWDPSDDPGAGAESDLERWRAERLRRMWKAQDHPLAPAVGDLPTLIDPDLLADVGARAEGAAATLAERRTQWVVDTRRQLAGAGPPGETESDRQRFDRLVESVLGPDVWTRDDPSALATRQLDPEAFVALRRLHAMVRALEPTGQPALLPSEWADVYDILTQVLKTREYAGWREEELELEVALSGEFFALEAGSAGPVSPFRVAAPLRRIWLHRLRSRIAQQRETGQGLKAMVLAAEESALPALCRHYCDAAQGRPEWLTQRLLIDVEADGHQLTTRLSQASETLQTLLFSLRTRRFASLGPEGSPLDTWPLPASPIDTVPDRVWQWISSYSLWQAAKRVWLFPENLVFPQGRQRRTGRFEAMMTRMRTMGCRTPDQAIKAFDLYIGDGPPDPGTDPGTDPGADDPSVAVDLANALRVMRELVLRRGSEVTQLRDVLIPQLYAKYALHPQTRDLVQLSYLMEGCFFVPLQLALELQRAEQHLDALAWYGLLYAHNTSLPTDQRAIFVGLNLDRTEYVYSRGAIKAWLETLDPHVIVEQRPSAYTRFVLLSLCRCLVDYADAEFAHETNDAIARAQTLYLGVQQLLRLPVLHPPHPGTLVPPDNPVLDVLTAHAAMNLMKIHQGRNIAGLRRQQSFTPPAAREAVIVSGEGQIQLTAISGPAPTPYRYGALIERAKHLVNLAQQIEGQYLSALERRDAEVYDVFRARLDLDTAQSNVTLQDLRVVLADANVTQAGLQQERSRLQADTYKEWIAAGPSRHEDTMITAYKEAHRYRSLIATFDAAITAAQASVSAASGGILGTGIGVAWGPAALAGMLAGARASMTQALSRAEMTAQIASIRASQEYRMREWDLQEKVARRDVGIAGQQVALAGAEQDIAMEEARIARRQAGHARATVEFLGAKFTNADLYNWMSGVLGGIYAYFLQQATAMARLAESQLAFERQDAVTSFIKSDYWRADVAALPGAAEGEDRRGLTGSARLLQAIYQLDQQAFETSKRKLQLTKVISLAALAPYEFQQFRETGLLTFRTPLSLFDADFPGHYVRLVKRVRVSVVALIPPNQGIKATLSASGLSRVAIGPEVFQTITIQRDPESVALTSPMNATGVFDLDAQPELLLPFEGIGVDTTWELEMPRAANPFDYRSLADVLLTLDYTALQSADYRQEVIMNMNLGTGVERAYSVRQQFADAWYDLHNGSGPVEALTVSFATRRDDFPPNLAELEMQHVLLCVVSPDAARVDVDLDLQVTPAGGSGSSQVFARRTHEGVLSTRRGHSPTWMAGASPDAAWRLTMPPEARAQFRNEEVEDILLVLTCAGRLPAWP